MMLSNRRDRRASHRRVSLGLEGLEGRKLLSTVTGTDIDTSAAVMTPLDLNPQPLPPGFFHHVSME